MSATEKGHSLRELYKGIFHEGPEQRTSPLDPPPRFVASKKLIRIIQDAREANPTDEAFADWLANFMEGYAAHFAHPVFDVSEGADGSGPECSLCGMLWPMCGHHNTSAWKPVARTTEENR